MNGRHPNIRRSCGIILYILDHEFVTVEDVAVATEAGTDSVRSFFRALEDLGVLRIDGVMDDGTRGPKALVYRNTRKERT